MSSDVEHTTDCLVFSNSDCDCGLPYDRIAKLEQDLLNLQRASRSLAVLVLQSDLYHNGPYDYRKSVDEVLGIVGYIGRS